MSDEGAKLDAILELVQRVADASVPLVVAQAVDDVDLPDAARLTMWHLRRRLNTRDFVEVYAESLATETRRRMTTVGQMLTLLVRRGYLEESAKKRPRAFRFPSSRKAWRARAA